MKMKKMYKFMVLAIIFTMLNVPFARSDLNFYQNYFLSYYYQHYLPTGNLANGAELKNGYTMLDTTFNSEGSSEIIGNYPSSANRSKMIQTLMKVNPNQPNSIVYFQFGFSSGQYRILEIQFLNPNSIKYVYREQLTAVYTSPTYALPEGGWIDLVLNDLVVYDGNKRYHVLQCKFVLYDKDYNKIVNNFHDFGHSYLTDGCYPTETKIVCSYLAPSTNVRQAIYLIRYGSITTHWYLQNDDLESMLFERTIDIKSSLPISDPNLNNKPYWGYFTIRLKNYNQTINFSTDYNYANRINQTDYEYGNKTFEFSYNYTMVEAEWIEEKYYYNPQTYKSSDFGNWKSFNFLRDGIVFILNSVILIFQFILYLLIVALNYLLWVPLVYIIILFNNFIFYGLVWAITGIVWVIAWIAIWLWEYALKPVLESLYWDILYPIGLWLWENVLKPIVDFVLYVINAIIEFIVWFRENGWIELARYFIIVISFVLAVLLFVITLGSVDFMVLQRILQDTLWYVNELWINFVKTFAENFLLFVSFGGTYILLVGLIYIKYIYAKAKGYISRANRLQSMINVYKIPIVVLIRLSKYVIGFINGALPENEEGG